MLKFLLSHKNYVASASCSKEVNVGGNRLTQAYYGSTNNEIKLIDSLKYYQKCLLQLPSTMTKIWKIFYYEKFLTEHHYFLTIWLFLPIHKKNKILLIIAEGKGVIPYEIIVDMKSFFIKPGKDFWEKSEFFSELKLSAVDDESYKNSKYLYQTLQIRNLGDLKDLYTTQDLILLTEIIESRFQAMQNTYGFNPRKCNSASSMSGCI